MIFFYLYKEPVPCRLSLLKNDSEKVIVAEGTYHPELILDHHSNLLPDHVRVSVDDFFDEFKEFSVPVPSSVIKKLKHAHGTFTQWPKYLVSLMHDKVNYFCNNLHIVCHTKYSKLLNRFALLLIRNSYQIRTMVTTKRPKKTCKTK